MVPNDRSPDLVPVARELPPRAHLCVGRRLQGVRPEDGADHHRVRRRGPGAGVQSGTVERQDARSRGRKDHAAADQRRRSRRSHASRAGGGARETVQGPGEEPGHHRFHRGEEADDGAGGGRGYEARRLLHR